MVTRRRFLKQFSIAASTATTLVACNAVTQNSTTSSVVNTSSGSSSTTSGDLLKVKLGAVSSINSIDVWIPQDLGFFQEVGLEAEVVQFKSSTRLRDALIAGELDLTAQAPLHVYLSQLKQIPLKVVANRRNIVDSALVVRSDLASSVRQVSDLKDKNLSVGAIGSWSWALAQKYLQKNGLNPENDVKYVASESATDYALIKSGQVDASVTTAPDLTQLVAEKVGYTLVDPIDPAVHLEYFGASEAMTRAWIAHDRLIQENPEVIARLVKAINLTFDYLHNTDPNEIASQIAKRFEGTSVEVLADSIERDIRGSVPRDASISRKAYDVDQQVFLDTGVVEQQVPYEQGVYDSAAGSRA